MPTLLLQRVWALPMISGPVNRTRGIGDRTLRVVGHPLSIVLVPGLILAAFVATLLVLGGAPLDPLGGLLLAYGGIVVSAAGFVLVIWTIGGNASSRLAMAILLGSIVTSLFLTGGCLLTGFRAGTVFVWWSIIVAAGCFQTFTKARGIKQLEFIEVLSVLAIGCLVGLWCRRSARLLPNLHATGLVNVWSDYFIHATEIAQFGDPLAMGQSAFLLVKEPIVFYHYASYMLPAAVASVVDLPALGIATAILLPYGIFLTGLGSYAFARTVANQAVALFVPFALLLVPDASTYGFRNGFFGFHWLLFTGPGSGYGLAVAFSALTLVARWRSDKNLRCLGLGLLLSMALFEFRAQIFLLFAPTLAITLLWETNFIQRRARVLMAILLIAIVLSALIFFVVPAARDAWLHYSGCRTFLEIVHVNQQPTAYDGLYQAIQKKYGPFFADFVGICILMPITLGVMIFTLPLGLTWATRRTGWRPLDTFPLWCLATWLGLVILAPAAAYGGREEYQHRPFVLVYAITLVWTLLFLDRLLAEHQLWFCRLKTMFFTLFVVTLGVRGAVSWSDDPAQPRFEWGKQHFNLKLNPGLLEAAAFLHAEAAIGDTFALVPTEPSIILDDAATRFAALANVPAYLARPGFQMRYGRERSLVAEQRLAELNEIEATEQIDDAFLRLRGIGVRFLVVLGDHGPRFDPDASKAAFKTHGAAVYRIDPPK
jgi:hypothetical protein